MKRVIQFSKARYLFFGFSSLLVLIGIAGFIVNHGFNLGVDFEAGIAFQFQVAPASFSMQYAGPDSAQVSIPAGERALTSAGNLIITITSAKDGSKKDYPFRYSDYKSVQELVNAVSAVPSVTVQPKGDMAAVPTQLLPLSRPADITGKPFTINLAPGPGRGVQTSIAEMRATLASLGQYELQAVGAPVNQEFIARLPAKSEDPEFQASAQSLVMGLLDAKYGADQIILKSSDFVGPQMAQSLATQTIWLVLIAVGLILVYMMFRFRPAIYAVAAVLGILHDALVMLSFDAVFRVEVDAGTIAAILTILGYSINDTIVNFDRARENNSLMRGSSLRTILDTSVTQTLSRTFITSGATLLTVIALFVLTSGSIKNFALNMIVGILEGTYSTFISAFIVIEWSAWKDRRTKAREMAKYGVAVPEKKLQPALAEGSFAEPDEEVETAVEEELRAEPAEVPVAEPVATGQPLPGPGTQPVAVSQSVSQPVPGAPVTQAQREGPRPAPAPAFFGHSGSRKNKKHKRRHH
ncbi:MAG TPA: protein translocase subunit SecF [Spirochaetia bacterium]|nr:protein translocase subunit SecF [Spirochaetia bacterium]